MLLNAVPMAIPRALPAGGAVRGLRTADLRATSMHWGYDDFKKRPDSVIAAAKALGAKYVGQAGCLEDQVAKRRKDGRIHVGAIMLLISHTPDHDESGAFELGKLSLNRPAAGSGQRNQLVRVKGATRIAENEREHPLPALRKKGICNAERIAWLLPGFPLGHTHIRYDSTQYGYCQFSLIQTLIAARSRT